jgi:hypothetical protein
MAVSVEAASFDRLAVAAADRSPVCGATHAYYRYPARFSPRFASAAIEGFTKAGDVVLDPYMGGGTSLVEGMRLGRSMLGNDLNSLALFVTRVKTTALNDAEIRDIERWADQRIEQFGYRIPRQNLGALLESSKLRNMNLPRARFIKKLMAAAIIASGELQTVAAQEFVRCAILRTGQWALDGRETHTSLREFRVKLASHIRTMLSDIASYAAEAGRQPACPVPVLRHGDAATIADDGPLTAWRGRVGLVVTSPPYPGVHILYHRWQVDGRRETAAPYWVADCMDGQGASYYNFGDRREESMDGYFSTSLRTLLAIRRMLRAGGWMVQMVAFSNPETQLPRYLQNMAAAGFAEMRTQCAGDGGRIWRMVPGRKWHATLQGDTASAREVVLVHRAV